jgi:hypothetical protein
MRRVTEGWGKQREAGRERETAQAMALAQKEEHPEQVRLPLEDPIVEQANLSTDGVMMLVRQEGWKEVKLTTISAVEQIEARVSSDGQVGRRREARAHVQLTRHSYQAGLWDADTMAEQQYTEGVRRGLDGCERLSSVNDGAVWIERITRENFPEAVQSWIGRMQASGCGRWGTRCTGRRRRKRCSGQRGVSASCGKGRWTRWCWHCRR